MFPTVFWKYVNPICRGIAQSIQDGLLTNEVLEPFSRKKYYPENILKVLYKAIALLCIKRIRKQTNLLNHIMIIK